MNEPLNGYQLSRSWFDFCFANPELINPNHTAIFTFAIEHCNRLGWKDKFGFPSQMTMDAIGIKNHHTYIRYFNDLVDWGFFKLIQKSTNQYSANIISLSCGLSKNSRALDKAFIKHLTKHPTKHVPSTPQSNDSIDKPLTINHKPIEPLLSTSVDDAPKNEFEKSILEIIREIKSEYLEAEIRPYKITNKRTKLITNRKKEFVKLWPGRNFEKACQFAFRYKAKEWFGTETFRFFEPETLLSEKFTSYVEKAEQDKGEPYVPKPKGEDKPVYRIPQ